MDYLTLAALFDHAVPFILAKCFAFTGMIHVLRKFALILPGTHHFLEATMYECWIF